MLYEFCAENFERVPAAIDAGAKRIELRDNLAVGGTTPGRRYQHYGQRATSKTRE